MQVDEEHEPEYEGQGYRLPKEIQNNELRDALVSLIMLGDDPYLSMQASNLAVVDAFIMSLEYAVLQKLIDEERTPGPEAIFLSAQSQMWIFAAYELLRTWRARAKDVIRLLKNGKLGARIAELEQTHGFKHIGRSLRAAQLRRVRDDSEAFVRMERDLRRSHIPFRRLEFIRIALAKHEVAKQRNSVAIAPGYGRINPHCGALDYQMEKGEITLGNISRRDIADELRAMAQPGIPSSEELSRFDAYMDAGVADPFES